MLQWETINVMLCFISAIGVLGLVFLIKGKQMSAKIYGPALIIGVILFWVSVLLLIMEHSWIWVIGSYIEMVLLGAFLLLLLLPPFKDKRN